ncbi:MAG: glycosyl transferase [Methylocystis sp.]|nr:MAG: glycosyl transferase [Methylocystis sp.]
MPNRTKTVALVQTQAENAGAQEVARQLEQGFARHGWRTRQIFFFRRTDSFDNEPNVFFCARERPSNLLGVLKLMGELYKEFRREQPDVVVTLQHYGNVIAAPLARFACKPMIVANLSTPPQMVPGSVALADKMLGTAGFYDHIVANSQQTESDYRSYPQPYTRRITRIDHGFFDKSANIGKAEARAQLSLPQDVTLLGCAARLHSMKQIDLAIRILGENREQHLALAGQGPERENLETLAAELGVTDRLHFVGELDTAKMGVFLASIDCFVFPSSMETFGLAVVEAAQAGVPVVANDLDVLREVLAVDGEPCAILIDAQDTRAFAAAVRRVLDDASLSAALTSAGRRLCERYPLDAMIEAYLKLMEPAA